MHEFTYMIISTTL